jgi:hypothetical protein
VGAGITTNGFLSSMGKGADSPVVNEPLCTGNDLGSGERRKWEGKGGKIFNARTSGFKKDEKIVRSCWWYLKKF